ncbi:MAG: hypothetical protein ACLROY_15650 [Mediterraneibacter sp.]
MGKLKKLRERICALTAVVALLLTTVLPAMPVAAEGPVTGGEGSGTEPVISEMVHYTVHTTDVDGDLRGVEVTAIASDDEAVIVKGSTNDEGNVSLSLEKDRTYNFTLSKSGYDTESFTDVSSEDTVLKEISLEFSDFTVVADSTSIDAFKTVVFSVPNPVEGVKYTWNIVGENVSITNGEGTSISVTCNKAGNVSATAYAKQKEATANIIVNKINIAEDDIKISLNPTTGVGVTQITATVSGLPCNATGEATFTYRYKNNEKTIKGEKEQNETTISFALDAVGDTVFYRELYCDFKYNGDDNYNPVSRQATIKTEYRQSLELTSSDKVEIEIDGEKETVVGQEITYGECLDKFISLDEESRGNRKISYTILEGSESVNVDESGKISLTDKPGTAKILVTAAENDDYAEAVLVYTIVAKPKEITVDLSKDVALNSAEKIYDGDSKIVLAGTIKSNLLENGADGQAEVPDVLGISKIQATLWNVSDGSKEDCSVNSDAVKITPESFENATQTINWYKVNYESEGIIENIVTVNPRTLYLGTEDQAYQYGVVEDVAAEVEKHQAVICELAYSDEVNQDEDNKIEKNGLIENDVDEAGIILPNVKVDLGKAICENGLFAVGPHSDAIIPDINSENQQQGNYILKQVPKFVENYSTYLGDLNITEPEVIDLKDVYEAINIENSTGNVYIQPETDKIWVNDDEETGTTITLTIKPESDFAKFYDTVIINIKDLTEGDQKAKDIVIKKTSDDSENSVKDYEGTIRFQKNIGGKINKTNDVSNFVIYGDSEKPTFTFGEWTENHIITDKWVQTILFNHYKKSYYSIKNISYDDAEGSSVKEVAYYVWGSHDGETINTDSDISADKVTEKVKSITEAEWEKLESGEKSIPVIKEDSGEIEDLQGRYLVLVKVSDQVGNINVYTSNGLIVEVQEPSVNITGFDSTVYYSGDVPYTVNVSDNEGENIVSGIRKIQLWVKSTIGDETKTTFDKTYCVGYGDGAKDGYTLEEIGEIATKEINETVLASDNNSNNVTVTAKAYDQAGNETKEVSEALMIDTTDPVIEISYDNNDAVNQKYFRSGRTMTIKYTERNFEESQATFDITVDGKTGHQVKFEELSDFGITYKKVADSQGDWDISDRTDKREIEYELTFSADGDYKIIPYCEDLAGNTNKGIKDEGVTAPYDFTIDTIDPKISVKYYVNGEEISVSDNEENRSYSQKPITAVVSIDEHNFAYEKTFSSETDQMNLQIIGNNPPEEVTSDEYIDYLNNFTDNAENSEKWNPNNGVYTNEFEFTLDGNYSLSITYEDLAGRTCTYDSHYFTVDGAAPNKGDITVTTNEGVNSWLNKFLDSITFGFFDKFSNRNIAVVMDGDDVTSGVAKIEHYDSEQEMSLEEIETLSNDAWRPYSEGGYEIAPDKQFIPYMKVTDRAGNVSYFSTESGFVADKTGPSVNLECTNLNAARNGIFNPSAGTVKFRVTAQDVETETYSGIKEIWYEVHAEGNASGSIERVTVFNAEASGEEAQRQNKTERICDFEVPIDARFNSNTVIVTAHAVDLAGNEVTDSETVSIDITAPTIQVTYDLNSPLNERYYNATRTATVTVKERNFDESAMRFNITNTDGTMPSISGWSHSAAQGVSDETIHTCYVTFAADGDYTFAVNTTDLAGNDSETVTTPDFTIDQTDPMIQVSYDNNRDAENGYFNAERTATITVTEHNFNAAEVNAAITARLQGTGVSAPGLGSWSTRGDVHTASVRFSADADYTFDVDYTDLAGNAAADYQGDTFTIDQTVPEVEFFDIVDKSANKDLVAPGVTYSDINYSENGVKLTLKGAKHDEEELTGTRTGIANGESIKMDDFARTKENDDLYTLTAAITDKAGNVTEETVTFSVNRFGSVYVFSDATEKLLDDYYAKEEQDLVITEINVDTLVNNGISYGRDGELVNLEKGSDYTVKESGSDVSWKEYQYTIDKENFEEEGHYTVTIDSEDRATNVQNNKVKDSDIEFVIDKTAPSVVITGVENGEQYRADSRDMTVNVADNMAMGTVDVYLGDDITPAKSYKSSEIERNGGELTYTIGNADEFQNIKAVARDAAGNEAETEGVSVLVTSNLLIQYVNNTPLLVGSIIVILLIAGGACWYFLIFKKKKNEQAK